jgi:chromate reductase
MIPRITILIGTNRIGSTTLQLAQHVASLYRAGGAEVTLLDLSQLGPQWFTPDAYEQRNDIIRPEALAVLEAQGIVIITPEYNGSYPGVLKLFLDMLPFPAALANRPAAFIGLAAGQWGALRAVDHLQAVFAYRNAQIFPARVFIPDAGTHIPNGQPSGDIAARLETQTRDFIAYVCKHTQA